MTCYVVRIPDGVRLPGVTAHGRPTAVLPGEYLVHRLPPKLSVAPLYRFVGADAAARDVHVPFERFAGFVGEGVAAQMSAA